MNPTFSIIITSFNHDKFIGATITAALEDEECDAEVVVVDDGSTDDTVNILASFSSPRLHVIQQKNSGVSAALNRGIAAACGDYIALCGSDDIRHPGSLSAARNELELTGSDFVFCRPRLIDKVGIELRPENFPVFFFHDLTAINDNPCEYLFTHGNVYCASSVLGRKESFHENGSFNEALLQLQDYDYWLRAAMRGQRIYLSPRPWRVDYRIHPSNLSSNKNTNRMLLEERAIFEWISSDQDLLICGIKRFTSYLYLGGKIEEYALIWWVWCLLQHSRPSLREVGYIIAARLLAEDKDAFLSVHLTRNDIWLLANG